MSAFMAPTLTILHREVVRFLRQRNRIIGALGTPLVFWLLIGSGLGQLRYFFPGTVLLIVLFTAIFSTISIIEDRREGFLQGVLVSPVPRSALVLGKLLAGSILASGQGLIFLTLAPFVGASFTVPGFIYSLVIIFLVSFGLTGLGFLIAWKLDSTQGFHAVMNLLLMPMWLLSGAFFPLESVPVWLKWVMILNPLTYSLSALHHGFFQEIFLASATTCLVVTILFSALMFVASVWLASREG